TKQDVYGVYSGSYADRGSIIVSRDKNTLTVLPDDKIQIKDIDWYKTRQLDAFGLRPWRRGSHSTERVLEKPENTENLEIARSDRMGFPPKVEVFRWVQSEKTPQDR